MNKLKDLEDVKPNRDKMQQTIMEGWKLMERTIPDKTPRGRLLMQQFHYISPFLWLVQFVILATAAVVTMTADLNMVEPKEILCMCGPLSGVLAVPELIKDRAYSMAEVERCCKNGSRVLMIRLFLIGCSNVLMITILACVTAGAAGENLLILVIYGLTPFTLLALMGLVFARVFQIRSRTGIVGISAVLAAGTVFLQYTGDAFNEKWLPVWITVLLLSVAGLFLQVRVFMQGEYGLLYGKENQAWN